MALVENSRFTRKEILYLRLQYKLESDQIPLLWHVILGVPSITVFISQKYVRVEPSVQFPGDTVARGIFGGGPHSAVKQMIKEHFLILDQDA